MIDLPIGDFNESLEKHRKSHHEANKNNKKNKNNKNAKNNSAEDSEDDADDVSSVGDMSFESTEFNSSASTASGDKTKAKFKQDDALLWCKRIVATLLGVAIAISAVSTVQIVLNGGDVDFQHRVSLLLLLLLFILGKSLLKVLSFLVMLVSHLPTHHTRPINPTPSPTFVLYSLMILRIIYSNHPWNVWTVSPKNLLVQVYKSRSVLLPLLHLQQTRQRRLLLLPGHSLLYRTTKRRYRKYWK